MAPSPRKSLVSRAGAAARKVVSRGSADSPRTARSGAESATAAKTTKTSAKKTTAKKPAQKSAQKSAQKTSQKTSTAAKKATKAAKAPAKKASTAAKTAEQTAKKTAQKTARKTTKAPAKKAVSKPSAKKAATKPPAKKAATKAPAKKAGRAAATKPAARKSTASVKAGAAAPTDLVVLEAEDPWSKSELAEVRTQLRDDVKRLTGELAEVEEDLAGMIENSGEGAGNDQADVGSASFERDQEMVIVNNARDMLVQSEHALERIADGTYGKCENCGNPIGKNRLMAFPRATLCLSCKQREERR